MLQQSQQSEDKIAKPFRYLDLPIEVRYKILGILLLRGNIAVASDTKIKERFPYWRYERPQWSLVSAVSREMQREATEVLYSVKNTFVAPVGPVSGLSIRHQRAYRIQNLDMPFDMRDHKESMAAAVVEVKRQHNEMVRDASGNDFEALPQSSKWEAMHGYLYDIAFVTWEPKMHVCMIPSFDLLRIDLRNCRCPAGCCRLGAQVLGLLRYGGSYHNPRHTIPPKRIEIVGALASERQHFMDVIDQGSGIPQDRVAFVDDGNSRYKKENWAEEMFQEMVRDSKA